ncbi:hypothetical protein K6112_00145 [Methylophilales bacterium]|nr:hypothetical protein K6112_00145 [Methylophilales bacterium]
MKHSYKINNDEIEVMIEPDEYSLGLAENLSERFNDLAQKKDWFNEGFTTEKAQLFFDFAKLHSATENILRKTLSSLDSSLDLTNFKLEKYHQFVTDDLHFETIKRLRRIFPEDLSINVSEIVQRFSEYFETKLSFKNPTFGTDHFMMARINRPQSNDFNTAHKDIYEFFDNYQKIPQMINVWVPLSGVTEKNTLPLVPRSHMLPESKILRTKAGATVNEVRYSVNSIKSWGDDTSLIKIPLQHDEILIFSSHLIHGLAVNNEKDITRISFEFRLFVEVES